MDRQAREARQMVKNLSFKGKVEHIWSYYKWWIIGIAVGIILLSVTIYEIQTRPTYDLEIAYYSELPAGDERIAAMEEYFAQFVEDTDGDGTKSVKIVDTNLSLGGSDPSAQMIVQNKFMAEISAKMYPVFILDDAFAEFVGSESFDGTFNNLIDMSQIPTLKEKFTIADGEKVYWGTREIYPNEENDAERAAEYDRVVAVEKAALGIDK